jgi:hypothetical protein
MSMKRRVITTFKILAVTVTTAGCARSVAPEVQAEPASAPTATATPTPAAEPPAAEPVALPPAPTSQDPALVSLRGELEPLTPAEALARQPRFRPLCDRDGYPLVGNAMRKSPTGLEPSSFCALLRGGK